MQAMTKRVVYIGHAPEVVDASGRHYPRGKAVEVPEELAASLIRGDFRLAENKKDEG